MLWLQRWFAGDRFQLHKLLSHHFRPHRLSRLSVHERKFPLRVQADLQRALDTLMQGAAVRHFSGVQLGIGDRPGFAAVLLDDPRLCQALVTAPQYEEVDIGEAEPVRCLKDGIWLVEEEGKRFAVLLAPPNAFDYMAAMQGLRLQLAVPATDD